MPPPNASEGRTLGWAGADNRHNMGLPADVRNSRGNELWDHYSVGADLGPAAGALLGLGQELIGRPLLSRFPEAGNRLAPSVFNFKTPGNTRPGAIDPYKVPTLAESGENLKATFSGALDDYPGVQKFLGLTGPSARPTGALPPGDVTTSASNFRVAPPADNTGFHPKPPMPALPSRTVPAAPTAPDKLPGGPADVAGQPLGSNVGLQFPEVDTLPTDDFGSVQVPQSDMDFAEENQRRVAAGLPPLDPKTGKPVGSSALPQPAPSTLFDDVNAQESQNQTTFLQGGGATQTPTSRDQSRRAALADEYGQSAGIMPGLFTPGGGGGGGGDWIPAY